MPSVRRVSRSTWCIERIALVLLVAGAAMRASAAPLPVLDAAQWLHGHPRDWRVGRVAHAPAILVIEFPGLLAQGTALNRVAALIEKRGAPRHHIVGPATLARLITADAADAQTFYEGHDYRADDLARFFTLARVQPARLNAAERRLRAVLLAHRVIRYADGRYLGGAQALITFSATQPDDPTTLIDDSLDAVAQASIFHHELSHGIFFTDRAYRAHCWAFWRHQLTATERAQWRRILGGLGYDVRDETLMVNETQALLMHTTDTRAFDPQALGLSAARLASERRRFRAAAHGIEEVTAP